MEKVNGYFNKIKAFYQRYERIILPLSFLLGFLWDNFTLRRIDLLYENLVFAWNIFLVAAIIIIVNLREAGKLSGNTFNRIAVFLPIYLQFAFGNLFSGFLIFYTRAGSVFASWPFLILLTIMLFGNEFFRKRYGKITFQLSVFFIVLFSYCVFILPVLLKRMDSLVFILSGFLALLIITAVFFLVFKLLPEKFRQNKKSLLISIGAIFSAFQIMYFTNIIPPIPLSLKESGIYHSIEKINEKIIFTRFLLSRLRIFYFFRKKTRFSIGKQGSRFTDFRRFFLRRILISGYCTGGLITTKIQKSGLS